MKLHQFIISPHNPKGLLNKLTVLVYCAMLIFFCGCKKFVSVDTPSTAISEENVYNSDATAAAVLTGIYTRISLAGSLGTVGGFNNMSYYPGLSADELTLHPDATNVSLIAYYKNSLRTDNIGSTSFWSFIYPIIYVSNSAINGLNASTQLTPAVRKQLLGEAYFIRAFCYFYLVNLYGDVPLIISTDYKENALLPKTSKDLVYQQVISDLKQSLDLLNANYVDAGILRSSAERVRPNLGAAKALLSRVYLYTGNYVDAELQATDVLDNKVTYDTVALNSVFVKNSKETIWAIQPVLGTTSQNTGEGRLFLLPGSGPSGVTNPVYLSSDLVSSFEPGDKRKSTWTRSLTISPNTYNYSYKYTIGATNTATNEYPVVLRLAELYLIRAEARAMQGTNMAGAAADLNVIRKRAGLLPTGASTPSTLLDAILQERRTELFTEWGHRWLDLKRTGKIDAVMSPAAPKKGGSWDGRWSLYPIPADELTKNPALKQNPGYEN